MEITLTIETLKSIIKVYKDSSEIKRHYNVLLGFIRDLEFKNNEDGVPEKIAALDEILDFLGQIMLTAAEDVEEDKWTQEICGKSKSKD
jgi:hypothetical protein